MEDERQRASRYEADKDNSDEWGEAEQPAARRRLASMISVRLTHEEVAIVKAAAERRGLSVSAFLREAALSEARGRERATAVWSLVAATQAVASTAAVTILNGPASVDPSLLGDTHELTFS